MSQEGVLALPNPLRGYRQCQLNCTCVNMASVSTIVKLLMFSVLLIYDIFEPVFVDWALIAIVQCLSIKREVLMDHILKVFFSSCKKCGSQQ